jgi:hypothetical protein
LNPVLNVPEAGQRLFSWYIDSLASAITRVVGDAVIRIPPSEFKAWAELTGRIVSSWEYDTLIAMDRAFCAALTAELSEMHARQQAEAAAKNKTPTRRGK